MNFSMTILELDGLFRKFAGLFWIKLTLFACWAGLFGILDAKTSCQGLLSKMRVLSAFEMSSEALPADFFQQPTRNRLIFKCLTNFLLNFF